MELGGDGEKARRGDRKERSKREQKDKTKAGGGGDRKEEETRIGKGRVGKIERTLTLNERPHDFPGGQLPCRD